MKEKELPSPSVACVPTPKRPTIGVAIIARNAGRSIYDCIKSFEAHVDQIVVVLAGESNDNTAIQARKASKKVELYPFNWIDDFSAARNFSFSKIKTDWTLWLDSDDVLEGAERLPELVSKTPANIAGVWFPYFYAFDDHGNCTTLFDRERLLRSSCGWVWRGRIHETVGPINQPVQYAKFEEIRLIHKHMEIGGSRSERNFRILSIMHKESPEDRRVWMYLGFQHFARMAWETSVDWFLKFAADSQVLPIERYQCLTYAGRALRQYGKFQDAVNVDLLAVEAYPDWADAYIGLSANYLGLGNWDKSIFWGEASRSKVPPDRMIFVNPLDYTYNINLTLSMAYANKMQFDKALESLDFALKVRPRDQVVIDQINRVQTAKQRKAVYDGVENLYLALAQDGDWLKAVNLGQILPEWLKWQPQVQQMSQNIKQRVSQPIEPSPLTKEQEEWLKAQGGGECLTTLELSANPETDLEKVEKDITMLTVGHQTPKVRNYSIDSIQDLLISRPNRRILSLHQMENGCIGAAFKHGEPKTKSIKIVTGIGFEKWTPSTIQKKGCGGSEIWASEVAQSFQEKDYQAFIYQGLDGVYDGVVYRHVDRYQPTYADIFISSRIPEMFDQPPPAKHKFLWFHDVHRGDRLTPQRVEEIDYIVGLTKWHVWYLQETYPFLKGCEVIDLGNPAAFVADGCPHPTYEGAELYKKPKLVVIGNGIDTSLYRELGRKHENRFIWSSSPDRGLLELLKYWGRIRQEMKGASLHIFYGWEYFDTTLFIPQQQTLKEEIMKLLNQPSIHWEGRVGQERLSQEFMKASYWFYPLHYSDISNKDPGGFRETCCITAIEAQAAECLCIVRASGGLGETVNDRGVLIPLDAGEKELDYFFNLVHDENKKQELKEKGRRWALTQDWSNIAQKILSVGGE